MKWYELLLTLLVGGLLIGFLLLAELIFDGDGSVGDNIRTFSHAPHLWKLLSALFLFGVFCTIIWSVEAKMLGRFGMPIQIAMGILTGILVSFLIASPSLHTILVGACVGGVLGISGKYWIKVLENL